MPMKDHNCVTIKAISATSLNFNVGMQMPLLMALEQEIQMLNVSLLTIIYRDMHTKKVIVMGKLKNKNNFIFFLIIHLFN